MKNWTDCWLAYPLIAPQSTPLTLSSAFSGTIAPNALKELAIAAKGLYHCETVTVSDHADIALVQDTAVPAEGYHIHSHAGAVTIAASDEQGALYGTFALLRQLQMTQSTVKALEWEEEKSPAAPLRIFHHWDNLTGDIERGYAGTSIFYHDNELTINERTVDYARMAASVGINTVIINNVNVAGAAIELITPRYYAKLREFQRILADYGMKMFLCIDFAASMSLGGMDSADPCDPAVQQWWKVKADEIWANLPGLGGFCVKADSEGRPGPFTYGRNHADGANMLADAVAPHGGLILWRCFVYNCQQDWRDRSIDRACACTNHYAPLDGQFRDNVILQIKNGPMDFQVREPVNPLFGRLTRTHMIVEFQITQEYTGQQRHVCYLIPWYQQVLGQELYCEKKPSTVGDIVKGRTYGDRTCGLCGVTNIGNDKNWTGHDLAAANLYGFGRMAYDESLTAEDIAAEWARLTYGRKPKVEQVMLDILMQSWPAYEKYNAPLGVGWFCQPATHYGPNPDGYEFDRWGTYHRAGHKSVGMDRTVNGTNYVSQYHEPLKSLYNNVETCPENLLLFFHHLPYDYVMKNGETLLQQIYNDHFEGAELAASFQTAFETLKDELDEETYARIHARFEHQTWHAALWRDVINTFFYRRTGIVDKYGRKIYE